jgi:sugar lactone lactonase YvrE
MKKLLLVLLISAVAVPVLIKHRYGGGEHFPAVEISQVSFDSGALEIVANLPEPPGNIAVSDKGRIFFTFHPEGRPSLKVAEWVDGEAKAWPSMSFQTGEGEERYFQNVLSLRIDQQGRLWTLDNAHHGLGQTRLLAFDIESGEVVHEYEFSRDAAPRLSHLNDFQVSADGSSIFIADASIMGKRPALIIYDVANKTAHRVLENHVSVVAERYTPVVQGRHMEVFGIFSIRPGVDSIALDRQGEWLYFAAVTATKMYRARVADLLNRDLSDAELAKRVEAWATKSETDGITTDNAGNVYLTDPGNDAIHRLNASDGSLETLLQSTSIRWPDGMSFGPEGYLYFTCSALHHVIGRSQRHKLSQAPYQIFRFKPGITAPAGH